MTLSSFRHTIAFNRGFSTDGIILCFLLLFSSCSNLTRVDTSKTYKHDLIIKSGDKVVEGVGVFKIKDNDVYNFEVEDRSSNLDVFTLSSCTKFLQKEKAWNKVKNKKYFGGLWNRTVDDKSKITFSYNRSSLERDLEICPVRLESIDKDKGVVSWGMFLFENPVFNNKYWITCNDKYEEANGSYICQNLVGNYIQVITKDISMFSATTEECSVGITTGRERKLQVRKGYCTYTIDTLDNKKKGVLITVGIDDIMVRE